MAATKTETDRSTAEQTVEEAIERARKLNEQILEAGRNVGIVYLEAYERTLEGIATYQEQLASAAEENQSEWIAGVLKAQADFTRRVADSVVTYYQNALKQQQ
jgi:hypothetical protein